MHHTELFSSKKNFILKLFFFLVLLVVTGLIYLESSMMLDAVYFVLVFILFMKFLIMKLYH